MASAAPVAPVALLLTSLDPDGEACRAEVDTNLSAWISAVEGARGTVIKRVGTGIYAWFARSTDAIDAAAAAQARRAEEIRIAGGGQALARAAIHAGRPIWRDGDAIGRPANRCARLLELAHPGQIFVSRSAYDATTLEAPHSDPYVPKSSACVGNVGFPFRGRAAAGDRTAAWRLRRLGVFRLRDLRVPEELWHAYGPSLPADLPPTRHLAYAPRVPVPLDRLIGREEALAELAEIMDGRRPSQLSAPRLVTLTGAGGAGKTRLAIETARIVSDTYRAEVWFVSLAEARHAAELPGRIAASLALAIPPGADSADCVAVRCSRAPTLLILDNCEHLLDAAEAAAFRRIVAALLAAAPKLRLLATSRRRIGVVGERAVPVQPLEIPNLGPRRRAMPPETESERLFAACARRARSIAEACGTPADGLVAPHSPSPPEERAAVAAVCRALDGLPLAIRLVAAHAGARDVRQIAAELTAASGIALASRSRDRDVPERHLTLEAALDWSYRLLPEAARSLLRLLWPFEGGFTPAAAAAMTDVLNETDVERQDTAGELDLLQDHAWIAASGNGPALRYRLLEPVRAYCRAIAPAEWVDAATLRHPQVVAGIAAAIAARRDAGDVSGAVEELNSEVHNLRAAVLSARATGQHAIACRITAALGLLAIEAGLWDEAREWTEAGAAAARAVEDHAALASLLHARANLLARCADRAGADHLEAVRLLELDSLDAATRAGAPGLCARALINLASIAEERGDIDDGERLCARGIEAARAAGDVEREAVAHMVAARLARRSGGLDRAQELLRTARDQFHASGEAGGIIMIGVEQADLAAVRGHRESRIACLREALSGARRAALSVWIGAVLRRLGDAYRDSAAIVDAAKCYTAARLVLTPGSADEQDAVLAARLDALRRAGAGAALEEAVRDAEAADLAMLLDELEGTHRGARA